MGKVPVNKHDHAGHDPETCQSAEFVTALQVGIFEDDEGNRFIGITLNGRPYVVSFEASQALSVGLLETAISMEADVSSWGPSDETHEQFAKMLGQMIVARMTTEDQRAN